MNRDVLLGVVVALVVVLLCAAAGCIEIRA